MTKLNKTPPATRQDFPIVGIGASAGGLEAFKRLLTNIPSNSGMAYVFVQHLDPAHDSVLTELMSQVTGLPVNEITDDIHLAPNHVYVIPENKMLTSTDGVLKLNPRDKKTKNVAIDVFFTSLAEVHLKMAVGILLSGNGTDGTNGLKAIKEHGGSTFAQEILTASNKEMPRNAIDAGVVDFILPPEEIPQRLIDLMDEVNSVESITDDYDEVLRLVSNHSGVDFTYYKQSTIHRRILRRMAISKTPTIKEYIKLLQGDKTAPQTLLNDLLIPVTEFFRDPKIFQSLSDVVFPLLLQRLTEANSIRIWVAGCSTGEEAYSLAILLHEYLGANKKGVQIQVFASDISELAIAKARIGFYKKTQLKNVSEARLSKYFTGNANGYKIKPEIRELCVFAVHNFLKDPPFAKIDLLSCRNVLIYMDTVLQKKCLTTFHYSLKSTGFLLLGKSETTSPAGELFLPFEKLGKIYTPNTILQKDIPKVVPNTVFKSLFPHKPADIITANDFKKSAEAMLLSQYTPAAIVVNQYMDIVHMHGPVSEFIELSQGKPTFNLLKLSREGLSFDLRNTFNKAKESMLPVIKEGIQFKSGKELIEVSIEIQSLPDTAETYFLVLFSKAKMPTIDVTFSGLSPAEIMDDRKLKRIAELEKELARIYGDVIAVTEQQSGVNDLLQSANEELLSGSEELQSLNEELETSKEELQSTNEELIQINRELVNKQEQINISKNYTKAIIATLREPIVVLDTKLTIRNINKAFAKKYDITKVEAKGKLIYEIQNHLFDNPYLRSMLEKVLAEKIQMDNFEITINLLPYGESVILLNARHVTNEPSKEQLILLALEDITERRNAEKRLQAMSAGFENKVQERTYALRKTNKELKSTVKDLNNANIQLQEYAYIASHDLQEPLRKISMFINQLGMLEDKPSDKAAGLLEKISKSALRMNTLIKDLLAYSYLGNHEKQFIATDLNIIMRNILIDFEVIIEQGNVAVEIGEMPCISAIPLQMNQLFYNLVSNALKFHKTDGSLQVISINASQLTHQQIEQYQNLDPLMTYFEIVVKDNGIGFDEKYEKKIFTIFQRLQTQDIYSGTGIGLAIGKKIVDNHKGIIFSKAAENAGAEFHIILPLW